MALLVFLGVIVDWATETPPAEFFSRYGWALAGMGFVILVIRPVTALLSRGLTSIAFVPSLTALVRWRSYRYVLRQSLAFFQNDFAGPDRAEGAAERPGAPRERRQRRRGHLHPHHLSRRHDRRSSSASTPG